MVLCCAALCSQMTFAQPRVIGIDELFRLAEEQSMSIRSFESGAAAAAEGVRAARAERLPDVGVTVSASFLGDGRLWDRSFGEGMKVDIPHFGNNFALEAQQVAYAGGAVRSGICMAELEQRDAETSLERNRQDICFLLLGHYLNLYKIDNRIRVLRENLALTEQVLETMRARPLEFLPAINTLARLENQLNAGLKPDDPRIEINFEHRPPLRALAGFMNASWQSRVSFYPQIHYLIKHGATDGIDGLEKIAIGNCDMDLLLCLEQPYREHIW